jgi:hypothetical protein
VPVLCRGVELDDMRRLAAVEAVDTLARLGIPQPDPPVEPAGQELGPVVVKREVGDGLVVPRKRPQHLPPPIHIPDLDHSIRRTRQAQVTRPRK